MAPEGQSESVIRFRRPDSVDTLLDNFRRLREEEQLLDVSLVCQGKVIRGHKLLLAATCDYFRSAFISLANTTCHTTAVIIKDMSYEDLENIVDFIYDGHIAIRATEVPSFIQSAEALQLTGIYYDSNCRDLSSTTSGKPSASKLFANATTLAADSTNMLIANSSAFNLRKILPTAAANMMNGSKLLPFIANHDESAELNQQYHHLLLPKSNYKREADNKSGLKQSYSSRRTSKESDLSSGVGGGGGRHELDSGQSGTASGHHGHQDDDDDDSLSDGEMMIEMPAGDGEATDSRGGDSDHHQLGGGGDHGSPLAEASCRSRPSSQGSGVGGSGDNQQIGYKMVIEEKFSDEEEATGGRDGNDGSDCAKDVESEETENVIDLSSNGNSSNSNQANCGEVYKHKKLKIASRLRNDTKSLSPSSLIRQTTQNGVKASDTGDNSKASLYRTDPGSVNSVQSQILALTSRFNQSAFPRNLDQDPATARAIANSTTMALMSNILGNQSQNQFRDEPLGEQYAQLLFAQDSLYKIRGRGRPPRYSIDGEDEASGKCRPSFKVRPILPAGPGLTAGLAPVAANATPLQLAVNMPSAEPGVSQVKRLRLSGEPYPARGRKPKPVPPSREVNGKNKCPHCPQVYYSTQAMNDHINNVHSMNGQKYVCSICAKEFSWKISLNKHMRKLHNEDNNGGPVNCDTNNAGPHKPISTAIPMPV